MILERMFLNVRSVCKVPTSFGISIHCANFSAVKASAPASTAVGKKRFRLPVETDPQKLMKNCCGANYFKDGEEIKLKEDSEYPDWLWDLPKVPKKLHEYDPNTKEYWEKAEIVGQQREWKLRGITKVNFIQNNDVLSMIIMILLINSKMK